ncbi:AI-2E family transporter [candidate division KSB1 bacterium]
MALKKRNKSFFQKSQDKINELKNKLQDLTRTEKKLEKEEEKLISKAEKASQEVKVNLSIESVAKATIAILLILAFKDLLFYIKDVLIIFLVALFLSAAFNPAVDKLEKHRIPRALGILIMYIVVLGIVTLIFTALVPVIAEQVSDLALRIKDMVQNLVSSDADSWFMKKIQPIANEVWKNVDQTQILNGLTTGLREVGSKLTNFAGNAIGAIFTIFNGIFNLILVLILTFFMVLNKKNTGNFFQSLFPHKYSAYISTKSKEISVRIGEWVRGQVLLALAMGILTFVVFSIIGLDYALTLAMVSSLAEFIPYLGPLITFLSAGLIALNQDPILLLWLIPAYAIMQFLEGNIMVPLIVGRSVGLNPVVVLFSLLAGATLGVKIGGSIALGLVGMIIAVPIANIVSIFVADYTDKNK